MKSVWRSRKIAQSEGVETEVRPPSPLQSDWVWRPDAWCRRLDFEGGGLSVNGASLGPLVKLFHDGDPHAVLVHQTERSLENSDVPVEVAIEVGEFEGDFVSLVFDLPTKVVELLKRTHIVRLDVQMKNKASMQVYCRLNIRQGPNFQQVIRQFEQAGDRFVADFDLSTIELNEGRSAGGWIDLIFEKPRRNRIVVSDAILSRRPRAEIT